jgi:hypothetical protein
MAQTGYTPILIYSSSTTTNAPSAANLTNSTLGSELAINITDGKLFYKDNANAIQVISWKITPATAGGTGQSTVTTGDLLYGSATNTWSKLADVATGNALISGGVGIAPSWGKIGLTTHVSGTLPVANGGTNLTSFTANGVMYASSTSALATGSSFVFDGTSVGIGTSSPTRKLDVSTAGTSYIRASNTTNSVNVDLYATTAKGGIGTQSNHAFEFFTNNATVGTFDTSGNFLVGKTTTAANTVGTAINTDGTGGINTARADSTNTYTTLEVYSTGASAYRFYVGMGGTISATSPIISAISDIRFKENIRDLNVGLSEIMALKPRLYDWKEGKGADIKNARGFIAQEFEQVFPDLIDEWKDPAPEGEEPYKSVRQDLIPVLVKAIQELSAKNDALEARLALLEAK